MLTLRQEFRGKNLKGTAIELSTPNQTGATQIAAKDFLAITYPTQDVLVGIEAIGPTQGQCIVVRGERGLGKSHLMAALYHALTDQAATRSWLSHWAGVLADRPRLAELPLRAPMAVIAETLHRNRYKTLWDLVFDRHPHGAEARAQWESQGSLKTNVPGAGLFEELFARQPTALILDEYQTWFDGLTNTRDYLWKEWTFNFVQNLSEIAKAYPERLVLVVSVRNGDTEAFKQIHRIGPWVIDFKGQTAKTDRRRLLLHRLFENRLQIPDAEIEARIKTPVNEYCRLLNIAPAEQEQKRRDFSETWPFAPHLLQLLEDQVLVATSAQETRDLIRILASLYKSRGAKNPLLTAADFRLDDDATGIGALLNSVANAHHASLREKAQRNIEAVREAVPEHRVPHLPDIMGALWLRSIAVANLAGADAAQLQADITREQPINDNAFQAELAEITDNSFNIHQDGGRLVFREAENPQAKLMATVRNDKLFVDGADLGQLAREIRYVIGGAEPQTSQVRVMVLPAAWKTAPWVGLEEMEQPKRWDARPPLLVLPEDPGSLGPTLGPWLKEHLQERRNTVRFLLPRASEGNVYLDRDLVVLARAEWKAQEWMSQQAEYGKLHKKYQGELRERLKKRFERFAILHRFDFQEPERCQFQVETVRQAPGGASLPDRIEQALQDDLFIPEDFAAFVLQVARNNDSAGKLLRELREPRPNGAECIPWLGDTLMLERLVRLCARGKIALNLRGKEYLQAEPGESEEAAWNRMKGRLGTGKELDETTVLLPTAVPPSTATGDSAAADFTLTGGGKPGSTGGTGPTGGSRIDSPGGAAPLSPLDTPGGVVKEPGGATFAPDSIFGGGPKPRIPLSNPATSAINLEGKLESWNINPATPVHQVTLTIATATGAQLKKLLRGLPDGLTYALGLEKEAD